MKIITRADREARRGQPTSPPPIAQFRKKGCSKCPPIPVYSRQIPVTQLPPLHANHDSSARPA